MREIQFSNANRFNLYAVNPMIDDGWEARGNAKVMRAGGIFQEERRSTGDKCCGIFSTTIKTRSGAAACSWILTGGNLKPCEHCAKAKAKR